MDKLTKHIHLISRMFTKLTGKTPTDVTVSRLFHSKLNDKQHQDNEICITIKYKKQ